MSSSKEWLCAHLVKLAIALMMGTASPAPLPATDVFRILLTVLNARWVSSWLFSLLKLNQSVSPTNNARLRIVAYAYQETT